MNSPASLPRDTDALHAMILAQQSLLAERGLTSFSVLTEGVEDLSLRLTELDQGRKLWKWFIALTLLFLLSEALLIRFLR